MEKYSAEYKGFNIRVAGRPTLRRERLLFDKTRVCIVGTRRATPYGLALADMAGRTVAELGLTLVTSGALGCGAQAARAAKQAGGKVVAISAVGLDTPHYPAASKDVFDDADILVSVVGDSTPPLPYNFPMLNEIMAHFCEVLIVCEAGLRSGITDTCEKAAKAGATVFAFPGSVFSPTSQGCNELIATHVAHPVTSEIHLEDTLRGQFWLPKREAQVKRQAEPDDLMAALRANPMRLSELADTLDMDPLEVTKKLASLEMDGVVERLPDGRYSPSVRRLVIR